MNSSCSVLFCRIDGDDVVEVDVDLVLPFPEPLILIAVAAVARLRFTPLDEATGIGLARFLGGIVSYSKYQ